MQVLKMEATEHVDVKRMIRLTNEETKLLVNLIFQRKDTLESKRTDAVSNSNKARRWKEVKDEFNSK
jgi:hypothetical protein